MLDQLGGIRCIGICYVSILLTFVADKLLIVLYTI